MIVPEHKIAFDLRASWQCRALVHTRRTPTGAVLLSVLAHTYDEAMPTLLEMAFPGFTSIVAPFLCTAGKIDRNGAVVADVVENGGSITKDSTIYRNEIELRDDFRRLADELKLNDKDRAELFMCVQRWVVADRRLDPTFDRRDPDARRIVH